MTLLATAEVAVARVTSPAPRADWEDLLAADPTSLVDQGPQWNDVLTATAPYSDASRLYELDDGRRFVLPLVRRRGITGPAGVESAFPDGWGIGGLVGPDRDASAVAAVLTELAGRREVFTRIRPDPLDGDLWSEAAPAGVVPRPRRAHVIDLRPGPEALRANLHKSTRRNLVKGEKADLDVTNTATPEHLAAYYRLYELSLQRWAERSREPQWMALWRGRRRDPLSKLSTMAERLGDRFRLWLAWQGGEPVAGSIILLGNTAHGTRGAIDRERAGPTRASFLLEWLAIEEAIDAGCASYHLGETGTSASLATFKEGFGGRSCAYQDLRIERLPLTRADLAVRSGVKRVIGFREG
jgi:hypothetical protein